MILFGTESPFRSECSFIFGVEVELTDKVLVADWTEGKVVVLVETLQICLDQRMHRYASLLQGPLHGRRFDR